jgi:hypothetical protein
MKYQDTLDAILRSHSDHLRQNAHDHLYETARKVIYETLENAHANDTDPIYALDALVTCDDYYAQRGKLRDCITCIRTIIRDSGVKDEAEFAQNCLMSILVTKIDNLIRYPLPSVGYRIDGVETRVGGQDLDGDMSVVTMGETQFFRLSEAMRRANDALCACFKPFVVRSIDGLNDYVQYEGIELVLVLRDSDGDWCDTGVTIWEESTLTYQDEQRIEEYMEERDWCIANGYDSCPGLSLGSVA